jgi:hypothetical protein
MRIGLNLRPMSGGAESQVLPSVVECAFSVVNNGIYLIPKAGADRKFSIQLSSFATGKVKTVASIPGSPSEGFSLSPDGRSLLYTQLDETGSDPTLVENFQ